jgi:hypothetical protein
MVQHIRGIAMHKFAAIALTAALGLAGMGYAKSADAGVVVGVGVGLPGVVVAPPAYAYPPAVGVYAPYYRGWPYYYGRGFYGPGYARFGYGFRGGYGFGYGHGRRWR